MEQELYTSCMKINGIPLLPPLMTESIKEDMRRYRSLAMKVEENLKGRQLVKYAKDKCVQADLAESMDILKSIKYSSDSDISNHNTTSDNTCNSDSFSKMTIVEHDNGRTERTTGEIREKPSIESSASNDDVIDNDLPSVRGSTEGIHQKERAVDETETAAASRDVTLPESCKPEVPKTLDIVPLRLNEIVEADGARSLATECPKENENIPKLSRQGSYVLDTPSPCLLAHMETDAIDRDYVPTPTTAVTQRTRWSAAASKVEWQNERFTAESSRDPSNDESTCQQMGADIATELQADDSNSVMVSEHPAEEHTSDSEIAQREHDQVSDLECVRKQDFSHMEKPTKEDSRDVHASNSTVKSQELVANAIYGPETQSPRGTDESKYYNRGIDASRQFQDLMIKTKSSTLPEKLLIVYKQIEEMHKKQVLELISRQRKEQSSLQAEFEKQQMILLAEIRKCSLGMSFSRRQVDLSNATSNRSSSSDDARLEAGEERREQSNVNFPSKPSSENRASIVCPLDYISPKNFHLFKSNAPSSLITDHLALPTLDSGLVRKVNSYEVTCNNNNDNGNDYNSNCESHDRSLRKNSTVNRQLFPLDSNTMHVPVLDTLAYLDKHIRAVNTINAYARGYLVRRLMRTERVITLKKIYKEALHCMLKLHVDAPLNLAEVNFLHRLQLQCDAASMNLVELFAQSPARRMKVIAQDREIKESRTDRPSSSRSYSFATQKTLARKNLKEFETTMTKYQRPTLVIRKNIVRSRCQTWTSDIRDRLVSPSALHQSIRRSTSAGTVRKPWR